jgi:hypothetical protein
MEVLEREAVDAVVFDGTASALCRALRRDQRWARLPSIVYSSIFIKDRGHASGIDLGAPPYLDACGVPPAHVAQTVDALRQSCRQRRLSPNARQAAR